MQHMRFLTSLFLAASLLFVGIGCGSPKITVQPFTLTYWRYDSPDNALDAVIEKYRTEHPNITIAVTNYSASEYDQALLEAFAEDKGPDIFSIPNVLLHKWKNQIVPMPGETSVPTPVIENGKVTGIMKKTPSPTLRDISNLYVDVAVKDMVLTVPAQGDTPEATAVMGVPFSADTLAMFSNSDVLRDANVAEPPKTWQEFAALAQRLTVRRGATVVFSGASLGTADNVPHSTEILSLLIQQNGSTMTDSLGFAQFNEPERTSRTVPAIEAMLFYRDFANPAAATYSWNDGMPNALDAFVTGKTAFYFGYPADVRSIKERSPRLRFTVSAVPQINIARPISAAYYPIEVVSKKTAHPNEAWDFLLFASKAENVETYLGMTGQPPALRGMLEAAVANPDVAPFATQVLTAKSWYRGNDYNEVRSAFESLITTPFADSGDIRTLLDAVVNQINRTIQ